MCNNGAQHSRSCFLTCASVSACVRQYISVAHEHMLCSHDTCVILRVLVGLCRKYLYGTDIVHYLSTRWEFQIDIGSAPLVVWETRCDFQIDFLCTKCIGVEQLLTRRDSLSKDELDARADHSNRCTYSKRCTASSALCTGARVKLSQGHTYFMPLTERNTMTQCVSNVYDFALLSFALHANACECLLSTAINSNCLISALRINQLNKLKWMSRAIALCNG